MGKLTEAYVDVRAHDDKLNHDLTNAGNRIDGWSRNLSTVIGSAIGSAIGIGVGAMASQLADYFRGATDKAADLAESVAKVGETFGSSASQVETYVDQLAARFGIVKREALEAASSFGLMLQGMGMSEGESARASNMLVKLAGDLGSFHNLSTGNVLEKIRSGLSGEMEPLRILGINLAESKVQANAVALGLAQAGQAVSDYAKAVSRLDLIQKQSAKANGDLERTYDSLSNRQKRLSGDLENLQTDLGNSLIGPASEAIALFYDLGDAISGVGDKGGGLQGIGDLLDSIVKQLRFLVGFDLMAGISESLDTVGAEIFGNSFGHKSRLYEIQAQREYYLADTDKARKAARLAGAPGGAGDGWKPGDGSPASKADHDRRDEDRESKKASDRARALIRRYQTEEEKDAEEQAEAKDLFRRGLINRDTLNRATMGPWHDKDMARADQMTAQHKTNSEKYFWDRLVASNLHSQGMIDDTTYDRVRTHEIDAEMDRRRDQIFNLESSQNSRSGQVLGDLYGAHNTLQNQALQADTQREQLETARKQLETLGEIREAMLENRPKAYDRFEAVLRGRE